jgi:TetR/AcrR family transcriptional repressor of lmrAB and yxaGH operons
MIESAALLFRERGIEGTSFTDVIEHSGAPRGSIYHHFPGGKPELAEAATRWAGEHILASTTAGLAERDPAAAIDHLCRWWTRVLESTDHQGGCVIVAATLAGEREPAAHAAAESFTTWENAIAHALRARGLGARRARSLATLIISAIEGAIILSRAHRTTEPLDRVTDELHA